MSENLSIISEKYRKNKGSVSETLQRGVQTAEYNDWLLADTSSGDFDIPEGTFQNPLFIEADGNVKVQAVTSPNYGETTKDITLVINGQHQNLFWKLLKVYQIGTDATVVTLVI